MRFIPNSPMSLRWGCTCSTETRTACTCHFTLTASSRSKVSLTCGRTRPLLLQSYPSASSSRGEPYKFWGLWTTERHLFGAESPDQVFFFFGTDELGRDLLSRILYGSRISLSIGLVGVFLSFTIGIVLGGISGYYGGMADLIIQRFIEILNSIPTLPLWMGLSAALPAHWPIIWVYFGMVSILSLLGWTGTARVVRGKFLALREEEFVLAARFSGASSARIMFRHMLPSFASHLIASLTLAIPGMILGRDGLKFSRYRPQSAGHKLGGSASGGSECKHPHAASLAVAPGSICRSNSPHVQLLRRWTQGRRRSLWEVAPRIRENYEYTRIYANN